MALDSDGRGERKAYLWAKVIVCDSICYADCHLHFCLIPKIGVIIVAIEMYTAFIAHICAVVMWKLLQKWEMGLVNQQSRYFQIDLGWENEH